MAQAIPVLKLTGLLIRTLAKPLSNHLKVKAVNHEKIAFRLRQFGQRVHIFSTRITVAAIGKYIFLTFEFGFYNYFVGFRFVRVGKDE